VQNAVNRLTKKIGLVLISSSLVLSGCARHEDEIAERDDGRWGKDSAAPSGSHAGSSFPYHNSYIPGFHQFSSSRPGTNSFSSHAGGSYSGSSRGGFGGSAHAGGG
jgi:hypothetical protein